MSGRMKWVVSIAAAFAFFLTVVGVGSGSVSAASYSRDEAVNTIDWYCNNGYVIANATYATNIRFNETTGVITYDFNVMWKKCTATPIDEYAVTGYDGYACPVIGMYHAGSTGTQDCVKYSNRHNANLNRSYGVRSVMKYCGEGGIGFRCVNRDWDNYGIWQGGASGPFSYDYNTKTFPNRTVAIADWSTKTLTTGSEDVFVANICDYYTGITRGICQDARVRVSWERFNYQLEPTVSGIADNSVIELPRTDYPVTGTVRNHGPTDSRDNIQWQLTKVIYGPGDAIPERAGGTSANSVGPCSFYTGGDACGSITDGTKTPAYPRNDTFNHDGTTNIGTFAIGTRICFAMSVQHYTQASSDWRHSRLVCQVVGKSPKVNILGGDLFVGRSISGVTASGSSTVSTSVTNNSNGVFGSWGEYAIAAAGPVTNMASGSGNATGGITNLNLLTFSNTGHTTSTCNPTLGCYSHGGSLPDIAGRFRTSSATPSIGGGQSLTTLANGVYVGSNSINIEASTIGSGKWVVINAPNADVTIRGNIQYASGPFTSASQIPQVVIIANNITINEGVGQVDAWLVAPGSVTGSTVTGGVIRTCNRSQTELANNVCDTRLTINGPVIANRLLMLRTFGAGQGAQAGNPAEVFNFRPDAYIWAAQQSQASGRVTTVSTKELPPRY